MNNIQRGRVTYYTAEDIHAVAAFRERHPLLEPSPISSGPCSQKKYPEFDNYSTTATFAGKVHPAILATPLDKKYRAAIREGLAEVVNLKGRYVVIEW
jgi:hypothetical protein